MSRMPFRHSPERSERRTPSTSLTRSSPTSSGRSSTSCCCTTSPLGSRNSTRRSLPHCSSCVITTRSPTPSLTWARPRKSGRSSLGSRDSYTRSRWQRERSQRQLALGLMVAARQGPNCSRATRAGTDARAAPARAAGSRATHPDSAVGSPPERRARIQCARGVARRGRPPGGSACARSMRADGSRRAGSGTWRASGFEPGAQPTSAGSSRSCRSRLHSITSALLSNRYASPGGAAEDPVGALARLRKRDQGERPSSRPLPSRLGLQECLNE